MANSFLDKAFDIIFNEERIKLIREINEGYNHLILPKTIDIQSLTELGFSFSDILSCLNQALLITSHKQLFTFTSGKIT